MKAPRRIGWIPLLLLFCWMGSGLVLFPRETGRESTDSCRPSAAEVIVPYGGRQDAGEVQVLSTRMPMTFVENKGQWDPDIRFLSRKDGMAARFDRGGMVLKLEKRSPNQRVIGVVLPFRFEGALNTVTLKGRDKQIGVCNFFLGNDSSRWRTGVSVYGSVEYSGLYDGIDVRFLERDGLLEYDILLESGADLARVVIRCEGIESLDVDADGYLNMVTAQGRIQQKPPRTWMVLPSGKRKPVRCFYRLLGENRFGFEVPDRNPSLAMVIDPGLEWSTFLGGKGNEYATAVAHVASYSPVVVGYTASADFPTTAGAFDRTHNSGDDAFVTLLGLDGHSLLFSTFLGGSAKDRATGVVVDAQGIVTVTGISESQDFPTTPGSFSQVNKGGGDIFVTRLNATGSALVYSTFMGGSGKDQPGNLVLESTGDVVITGETASTNFPVTMGAFDVSHNGGDDAFVSRLSAGGNNLLASTFLGSTGLDSGNAVALDATGQVVVAGSVAGVGGQSNFPVTAGAHGRKYYGGTSDAFVTRLDAKMTKLIYSTFLGGSSSDFCRGMVMDSTGEVTVAGDTLSTDFPVTAGAFDLTYNGASDVFVTRLGSTGAVLVYSTFLGGTGPDHARALDQDPAGAVTVGGDTQSTNFPVTPGAFQGGASGKGDIFVSRLVAMGSALNYSSYVGGTGFETLHGLSLDGTGGATLVGGTASADFPATLWAYDRTHNGLDDAFVTRLSMLPRGVKKYGFSVVNCAGPLAIGVNRMPVSGDKQFAFTCYNAPPGSPGILAISLGSSSVGIPFAGIKLYVDPFFPTWLNWVYADSAGLETTRVAIPPNTTGMRVFCQYIWANSLTCTRSPHVPISTSNALFVTIQ